jgi:hypothetical protein
MSSEMNAVTAKLCVYTEDGINSTTLPPNDPNAHGSSSKSSDTVNVSVT